MELSPYFLSLFCISCFHRVYGLHTEGNAGDNCVPECPSHIYCQGELLHDIQMSRVYPDSKTFVDKQLLYPEEDILRKYSLLKNATKVPTREQLQRFINENFKDYQLEKYDPPDFNDYPTILKHVADDQYRNWILQINAIWKDLAHAVSLDVHNNSHMYSLIYLPFPFVKAGGRFQEMYYWDSYWIIRGLLLCDMYQTARGIIENMIWLVQVYGHVPNGSRKYYIQRSQPPLLIQMAATYHSRTKDDSFIERNIKYLDMEFQYWYTNRMISVYKDGRIHKLARYIGGGCGPRPESYYEDFTLAANVIESERSNLYRNLKSAAETGWDFSSRHIINPQGSNEGSLLFLNTVNILYVDLNSILHANAVVLSQWYKLLKYPQRALHYKSIANKLLAAIHAVFWNEQAGIWQDWDLMNNKSRDYFYPSNLTPLWTGSYNKKKTAIMDRVLLYLSSQGIIKSNASPMYYGVPTSLYNTTQQWDFPNCWAPLQAIVIQGLERSNHPVARFVAFKMAENWIKTMYAGFTKHGFMYEKYSATKLGETGDGGEYSPQTGFGWTNGFCLEIFNTWGIFLRSKDSDL